MNNGVKELGKIKYKQCDLTFYLSSYADEKSTMVPAIYAQESNGEMYAVVTVNLAGYDFYPVQGNIFISHDIVDGDKTFLKLFIDTFCLEETQEPISYGFAKGLHITLKPEYAKLI